MPFFLACWSDLTLVTFLFPSPLSFGTSRDASSGTLPRCLLGRLGRCIPRPKVFPSRTRQAWAFSSIFHDAVSPSRLSPRSFPADRRTPASSQWHGPAGKTGARPTLSSSLPRDLRGSRKNLCCVRLSDAFPSPGFPLARSHGSRF